VIATPRLLLRPFAAGDADALFELYGDPEVMTFTGGPKTREQTEEGLARLIALYESQGFGLFAVEHEGRVIGRVGFIVQMVEGVREVELAYMIARAAWGRGFGVEACMAARDWGLQHLPSPRLVSLIDPRNLRSLKIAEKLGSRFERVVTFHGQRVGLHVIEAPGPRS
jgi:ribosomal-protein-alanine N-acetyltransferase